MSERISDQWRKEAPREMVANNDMYCAARRDALFECADALDARKAEILSLLQLAAIVLEGELAFDKAAKIVEEML